MTVSHPVQFSNPPVAEVVCGITFATSKPLKSVSFIPFWKTIEKDFPEIDEAPPLPQVIEPPTGAPVQHHVQFNLGVPSLRTWLRSADKRALIQVQPDRFMFNWKRVAPADAYPSFKEVYAEFERRYADFLKFLTDSQFGQLQYKQFELTYINLIGVDNGLKDAGENRVLVDHTRDATRERFLPYPSGFHWATSYVLPADEGRLHIIAQGPIDAFGEKKMRLDMIARGVSKDHSEAGRTAWFDMAHTWITQGFADSTSRALHESHWKRTS
jgi:uncharacterized protein (TIGR04255 family)